MPTANVQYLFIYLFILEYTFLQQNLFARVVMAFSLGVSLADYKAGRYYYSPIALNEGELMRHYRWYLLQR